MTLFLLTTFTTCAIYALLALGLGLIFGQLGVVHVAYGDFVMVGAYAMYALRFLPFVPRVLCALAVGAALALLTERLMLKPLYDRGLLATLLAMWGVGIILRQSAEAVFGVTAVSVDPPIAGSTHILGTTYPSYRLVAAGVAVVLVVGCLAVIFRTDLGVRLRATLDNREMASLLGISPARMVTLTFVVGSLFAVLAGALQSPILGVTPDIGFAFLAPSFFAVLLGRPGSLWGPVVGAVIVGVLSNVLSTWLTQTTAITVFYALLIVLIALQPQGPNLRMRSFPWRARRVRGLA